MRLQIVAELARGEGECTCGSFELPVTKSTCTHHFKVLREAGVIKQRQQGTTRLNTLRRERPRGPLPGAARHDPEGRQLPGRDGPQGPLDAASPPAPAYAPGAARRSHRGP